MKHLLNILLLLAFAFSAILSGQKNISDYVFKVKLCKISNLFMQIHKEIPFSLSRWSFFLSEQTFCHLKITRPSPNELNKFESSFTCRAIPARRLLQKQLLNGRPRVHYLHLICVAILYKDTSV